jgi:hypothetical protein
MLLLAAVASGLVAWGMAALIRWPEHLIGRLLECSLASAAALLVYFAIAAAVRVPEVDLLIRQLRGRLPARLGG